jgi:sialidase-1
LHGGGVADYKQGNESTVAELGNGDLMLNMRNMDTAKNLRMSAISSDGGESFAPATETTLIEPINNGCQGSLLRYSINSQGAANLLFANPNHGSSRRNGTIKLSTNDGKNWTRTFMYVPENTYTSYSDLVALPDARVGVLYERGRNNDEGIHFRSVRFDEIVQSL